jgi:RNA polymerase sigma-70 factor (ECF subfamily)
METDPALLNAARTMDKDALIKIFDLYSPALYKYALHLCSDPVTADHIVGDVFAKLLEQLSQGKGPSANLRSYLYESAYHHIVDETRYARRRVSLEVTDWFRQDANSTTSGWEDHIMFKQVLFAMQNKLSDDQRHVLVLRFLEEFSIRETATILGKKEDHVRVIQSRAIMALRRCFDSNSGGHTLPVSGVSNISEALGA